MSDILKDLDWKTCTREDVVEKALLLCSSLIADRLLELYGIHSNYARITPNEWASKSARILANACYDLHEKIMSMSSNVEIAEYAFADLDRTVVMFTECARVLLMPVYVQREVIQRKRDVKGSEA